MSQVLTEGTNLNVAAESTLGTLPSTGWLQMQPNSYGDIGPSIGKVARTPISKNRQNRAPIITDLDSGAPWQADVTKDLIDAFLPGIFMSAIKHSGGTGLSYFRPTAVTATGYTVAANGAIQNGALVYARGFSNSANNGIKVLAGTSTATEIKTAGLVVEGTPPANVTVDFIGVQGGAGDIDMDGSGNITTTTINWTTLGLNVGQYIYIPSQAEATAMGSANYAFTNAAYTGFARIKTITATQLTLEWRSWTVGAASVETTTTIRIFFSRWCRNVALDHADFLKTSYAFEVTYPGLSAGTDEYEYLRGNYVDQWSWNIPLTSKATAELSFVGTTSNDPTTVRQTGANNALAPVTNVAVSTSTDMMRFTCANVDESGISTDFKDIKITLKNNVSPEKQIGTLGASIVNVGRFECMVEATLIFTSDTVIKAVRDNRQVHMDFAMRNGEFGCLIDVMAAALDEADRNFPTNASVLIKTSATGFQDPTLNSTCGLSVFGYLPRA